MSKIDTNQNSLETKVQNWIQGFLHSPAAYDGKSAEAIMNADIQESKSIFTKELPKRKAVESIKIFKTKDDLDLRYWLVEKPNNHKVKILVHGSGSNFAKAGRAVYLIDRGFNVAMISYRGHSGNPGKANQKFIINDVISAISEILNSGYKMEDVFLEGSSLGTAGLAHALKRIYQESDAKSQFGGLVLKAAPLNLHHKDKDMIKSLMAAGINDKRADLYIKKFWNQEDAYSKIRAGEIKIIHGTNDDVVPVEQAEKIKTILERNNTNIELVIIPGEGHRLDLNQYGIY